MEFTSKLGMRLKLISIIEARPSAVVFVLRNKLIKLAHTIPRFHDIALLNLNESFISSFVLLDGQLL